MEKIKRKTFSEKFNKHNVRKYFWLDFKLYYQLRNIAKIEKLTQDYLYQKFLSEAVEKWKQENDDFIDENNLVIDFTLKSEIRVKKLQRELQKMREQNLKLLKEEND